LRWTPYRHLDNDRNLIPFRRGDKPHDPSSLTEDADTSSRGRAAVIHYPVEQQARETRVICRIHARRISLDAIHL
jgi:hypothetical protein